MQGQEKEVKFIQLREFSISIYGNPVVYYIIGGDCAGKGVILRYIKDNLKDNFCLCSAKVSGYPENYEVGVDIDVVFVVDKVCCNDDFRYTENLYKSGLNIKEIHIVRDTRVGVLCSISDATYKMYADFIDAQFNRIQSRISDDNFYVVRYEDILSGYDMSDIFIDLHPNIFKGAKISDTFNRYVTPTDLQRIVTLMMDRDDWQNGKEIFELIEKNYGDYMEFFGYNKILLLHQITGKEV